jgi:DNA invertase Pin-like site-specific DNA recombinase|tara:strand:- start:990 stop:1784 length:795 start_codon:yes stop_codon:yes gene_type:complete
MNGPIKQINNVFGYCRVSTVEQAQNGISLQTQQDLISAFIKDKYNREVDEWFIDDGVSGTVPILERNRCKAMTDVIDRHDVIVATRIDRLSRSAADMLKTIPFLEETGVTLYLCEQFADVPVVYPKPNGVSGLRSKFDMNEMVNKIMLMVLSAVAEIEHGSTVDKFKEGKIAWAERGYAIGGTVPFGYEGVEEKVKTGNRLKRRMKLVEVPEEQAVIKTIHACSKRGLGAKRIAKQVSSTHAGFKGFHYSKVRKILDRKFQGLS